MPGPLWNTVYAGSSVFAAAKLAPWASFASAEVPSRGVSLHDSYSSFDVYLNEMRGHQVAACDAKSTAWSIADRKQVGVLVHHQVRCLWIIAGVSCTL